MNIEQARASEQAYSPWLVAGLGLALTTTLSAGSCDVAQSPSGGSGGNTNTRRITKTHARPGSRLHPGHGLQNARCWCLRRQ
jgi:hypothetical protein